MDKIPIGIDTLNAVLGYLGRCPYQDVASVIDRLQLEVRSANEQAAEKQAVDDGVTADENAAKTKRTKK